MKSVQELMNGKKTSVHLLFCIVVLVLFYAGVWSLYAAGFRLGNSFEVFARYLLFLVCIYTGRWLCHRLYLQNKLLLLLLLSAAACFIIAFCWWLVIRYIFHHPFAEFTELMISAMPFFITGIVLGMLLKLIRASMQRQVMDAMAATEQKQSELSLLQSQLSPHFLFNTLNNIYSISIVQHELVPGLLLKLSDLLRYALYETAQPLVPLSGEIAYINNYIDFEKVRIGDRLLLHTDIENITDPLIKIPPMLLIVFIENAFKHAKNSFDQKIYIGIQLTIQENHLLFTVKNSYGTAKEKNDALSEKTGIGISNTIKRLNLLYKDKYALKQFSENELYVAALNLEIK